jgi:hypothetical protein
MKKGIGPSDEFKKKMMLIKSNSSSHKKSKPKGKIKSSIFKKMKDSDHDYED